LKKNLYKFGYSSPEDSSHRELLHTQKYAKKEFEDIVVKAIVIVLTVERPSWTKDFYIAEGKITPERIEKEKAEWLEMAQKNGLPTDDASVEKEVMSMEKDTSYLKFSEIIDEVEHVLIKQFSFEKVKYQAVFDIFGWQGLVNKEDSWYNPQEDALFDRIREKYIQSLS
jgi:hypothetical protein